jgi:hypothetical protein
MSTDGLTLGSGTPTADGQKMAVFRGSHAVCVAPRGTPLAAAHADMRSAAKPLRLWSGALVVALAATTTAAAPLPAPAAAPGERRLLPLERMDEVSVMVDDMTPDAEALALTREIIQADAESQLLRNGLRVHSSGSMPALYFQITVLCDDHGPCAIDVSSAAVQDVFLEAMATSSIRAKTWYTGQILLAPRSEVNESVRNAVRDQADEFAADVQAARRARQPVLKPSAAPAWRSDSEPRRSN